MVATCQKSSQGKNKILHDQQKNREILLFCKSEKIDILKKSQGNLKEEPL